MMLHRISISNFYSIAEKETFDLQIPSRTPKHTRAAESTFGRFSNCAILFGNNGSGKTNVLKALSFFGYLFQQSARHLDPGESIPYLPFITSEKYSSNPSELEAVFSDETFVYTYAVKFSQKEIIEERLSQNDGKKTFVLYERIGTDVEIAKKLGIPKAFRSEFELQKNVTLSSVLAVTGERHIRSLLDGPLNIYTDVQWFGRPPIGKMQWIADAATRLYSRNEKACELLQSLLSEFDVGITGVEFLDLEEWEKNIPLASALLGRFSGRPKGATVQADEKVPIFLHEPSGRFLLQLESEGTQNLYIYLFRIFNVLQRGGIAILDEFDNSVHPANIGKIIDIFRDKDINPKNAQLIMAVHTASLLQELEKEEIFFCHKDDEGRTHIYGLKDLSDVRRIDNYYAKYLSGYYGAIPHSHMPLEKKNDPNGQAACP